MVYDDGLVQFASSLAVHWQAHSGFPLMLDLQDMRFYTPGALATLVAFAQLARRTSGAVELLNAQHAPACGYLQRIDFFTHCGCPMPETFRRHDPTGRFVTLRRVDSTLAGRVDQIAQAVATCLFPEQAAITDFPAQTGPYDLVTYATTELVNNVLQHARAEGFILAQTYPNRDLVCVAIADCGIGIRGSFEESKPLFWDAAMNDLDAVRYALEPKISSKLHVASPWSGGASAINAGVGLSVLKELARAADGLFTLASFRGFYQWNYAAQHDYPSELHLPAPYPGTFCAVQFARSKLAEHQRLMLDAKRRLHLLDEAHPFDDLFEP